MRTKHPVDPSPSLTSGLLLLRLRQGELDGVLPPLGPVLGMVQPHAGPHPRLALPHAVAGRVHLVKLDHSTVLLDEAEVLVGVNGEWVHLVLHREEFDWLVGHTMGFDWLLGGGI